MSDKSDRGLRAMACSAFRWMVRMADTNGRTVTAVDVATGAVNFGMGYESGGAIPDLDDPATLGCFEHVLLFEAWPIAGHIQTHWTREGDGSIYVHSNDSEELWRIEMVDKAEAIVAAMEAGCRRQKLTREAKDNENA